MFRCPIYAVAVTMVLLCLLLRASQANLSLYVCEAGDPKALGVYTASNEQTSDGVAVYTNSQEMSFCKSTFDAGWRH